MTPAQRLLASALESEQEARRVQNEGVVRVVLPGGATNQDMRTEGEARLTRLVAHFEGRARLFRRCAAAAERIDAR